MITFATLHEAKRNGTLAQTLAAMTPAERVEAAQVCAANTSRSVSAWLDTFGELMMLAALVPDPDAWVAVSTPYEPADFRPVTTYLPDMVGAAVVQTGPDAYRALWMGYYVGEPFATYGAAECEAVAAWAKANPSTPDLNYYGNSTGGFDGGADIDPDGGGDDEDEWLTGKAA